MLGYANMEAGKGKGSRRRAREGYRSARAKSSKLCSSSPSTTVSGRSGKTVLPHTELVSNGSNSSEFLPLQTILLQCSDIYQLQDGILEKSIRQQRELSGHSQLDRDECEELFRQLEVHRIEWGVVAMECT